MRLGDETLGEFPAFDLELRRRLFFAIGILDTHAALDRGTIPILSSKAFRTPPLLINDDDMSPQNGVPAVSSSGSTDMSHTSMIYDAMICQRKLSDLSQSPQDGWAQWPKKLEAITEFEECIHNKHCKVDDPADPLEKLRLISAKKISVSMHLLLRRPPYRQPANTIPPWDDFKIMEAATNVLEEHLQAVPDDLRPWAWKNWVQWHALAVVLAELMVHPHEPRSDRSYFIATRSFHYYAHLIADTESGMLWRPIARLMRRVQRVRQVPRSESTKAPPNGHTDLYQGPANMPGLLENNILEDFDMFDLSKWSTDVDIPDIFFNNMHNIEDQPNNIHTDTPLLTWDLFLQDIDTING